MYRRLPDPGAPKATGSTVQDCTITVYSLHHKTTQIPQKDYSK
ncbi:hypothetical protein PP641_gp008 [Arthrobacter phage SilentRX]|uniref:Uncharacterized protein n=1 Tax=Arthrobacter phage SilentRX TaxID=2836091 RepID=A0A8F3E8S5_9CAUD|nr:hypothetical protein PP641_gp008 [Arthrobacter phage SilentRX]QWY82847.1 hypothetical protein SEA_SILENTRX_8 [Arthrobacter phage SilentRX]